MVPSGRSLLLGGLLICSGAPSVAVDSDGDTDLTDYQSFRDCLSGPFIAAGKCPCLLQDLDCDGDVDLRDLSSLVNEFTGSLAQQHLELDPAAVCLVPEERVPLTVELVESDGGRTALDSSQFSLAVEGVSGGVALQDGKPVASVFESGDVGLCGELAATYEGLVGRTRFAVASLGPSDETALDNQLLVHGQRLNDYAHARAKHDNAAGAFENEHTKLANDQAATFLRHEAFVFETSFGALTGGDNSPPCSQIRRPLGPPPTKLQCDQGFFELIDLGGAEVAFFVEPSNQVLLSDGSLGECPNPGAPLSDPSGCSRIFVLVSVQIRQLTEPGVSEAIVQEHLDVGPAPITAISASYVEEDTAQVLYLQNPPLFCASVFNSGGTIGFTANSCSGDRSGITTVGIDTSNVFWEFQAYTQPRENWINHQLISIGVQVSTPQYRDLSEAETAVMNLLAGLAKAELELAIRKQQALAQLNTFNAGPSGGTQTSTDYAVAFLQPYIDALKEQGQEFVTEQIIDAVEGQLGLPLEEVGEQFNELSGIVDKMKAAADLFDLLSSVDRPMSDTDRIRAVKQAFDLARQLGPGGPMVTAIAPFLDFYSLALGAIADALDVIDEMRKEQVLSTGECSIIEAIIADAQRRAAWQRACKLRQFLQAVRDP